MMDEVKKDCDNCQAGELICISCENKSNWFSGEDDGKKN